MAVTRTVRLRIEAAGDQADGHVARFEGWKGSQFLKGVLEAAGLTEGLFVYHMREWFKSSGFTKPVQPRRFDASGVHLWLKPGGNGSAVKGVLVPAKEFYTPELVYQKLKAYVEAQAKKPGESEAPPELDDPTTELLLLAVNEANGTYHKTQDEFDTAVLTTLRGCSFEADGVALDQMMEAVKRREFISYTNAGAIITLEGQEWLNGRSAAAAPPVAPPPPPVSAIDLLTAKRAKLERLMSLPELVRQSRDKQAALTTQIETLMGQLDTERGVETGLMAEVNEDAVRHLLGD